MPDNASRKASTTAVLIAAVRASHLRWCPDPIFSDEYAIGMVTPFWRLVANNRLLNRLVVDVVLRTLKPVHTVIIVRIRYAEDRLWEAVRLGSGSTWSSAPNGAGRLRGDGSCLSRVADAALPAGAQRHAGPTSQFRFRSVQEPGGNGGPLIRCIKRTSRSLGSASVQATAARFL